VSTTEVHNVHHTQKKQKDGQNITCGSCYGAESEQYKCCNTCDDVSVTAAGVSCKAAQQALWTKALCCRLRSEYH
jgi:hypothetical protein